MEMLARMNSKMDVGYKMTNYSCPVCKGVTLAKPDSELVYCPKCDKEEAAILQDEPDEQKSDPAEQQYEQFLKEYNRVSQRQTKSDEISKKIGSKLIQGWALLQESCPNCNVPLMKSSKGDKICVGCDKNYAAPQERKEQKKDKKKEAPKLKQKSEQQTEVISKSHQQINQVANKAVSFLDKRLEKAIGDNDLEAVGKIVDILVKLSTIK